MVPAEVSSMPTTTVAGAIDSRGRCMKIALDELYADA
jgi:hypothetical protein